LTTVGRVLSGVLIGAAWTVIGVLAVGTVLRLAAWDDWPPTIIFDSLADVIYLPVWLVAVAALVSRRWKMALAAGVLVAAQFALMMPEMTAGTSVPAAARRAPSIRLLDANVNYTNTDMTGYSRQIETWQPDVVTFEEAVPSDAQRLRSAGAFDRLPFVEQLGPASPFSFLVASRFPVGPLRFVIAPGGFGLLAVHTTLTVGDQQVQLWVVHVAAPRSGQSGLWKAGLSRLATLLRSATGPIIVAGDFNATWGNRGFRHILDQGFGDVAAMRGHPWQMTWSQGMPVLPPLTRIDHVLVRSGPVPLSTSTGSGPGSDHRDLRVVLAIPPAAQPTGTSSSSVIRRAATSTSTPGPIVELTATERT
jgi:endonuclease/exonuclease/phosphatase (EEP) superfamily protein YafD